MGVTIMEKITSLIKQLQRNAVQESHLKNLTFVQGEGFGWNHATCTISYGPRQPNAAAYLLHEYGHALLEHTHYTHDIDLLKIERAAWEKALIIAPSFDLAIDTSIVEDALDTYREWIHARALCPQCGATGIQSGHLTYRCVACGATWHVNEARTCELRRYITKKRS